MNGVATLEGNRSLDAMAANQRAVLASQILDSRTRPAHHNPGVTPRHLRRVEPHRGVRFSSNDVFTVAEWKRAVAENEVTRKSLLWPDRARCGLFVRDICDERIAVAVHRTDDVRTTGRIANGAPQLVDRAGQARIGDEDSWPDLVEQLGLGEGARARFDQDLQQLERFGREMYLTRLAKQSPRLQIELTIAETLHRSAVPSGNQKTRRKPSRLTRAGAPILAPRLTFKLTERGIVMVMRSRSKQIVVALGIAAIGVAVTSCGTENRSSLLGPATEVAADSAPSPDGATAGALGSNGVIVQLLPLFYPDGTEVVSANGEPDDAVLNRFASQVKKRIGWGVMTQHLTPFETYEIWFEGSNDGSDSFSWQVGTAKANARGALNTFGTVYPDQQPGPGVGVFTNPLARANLVIKTASGVTMQTAYFPGP